MLPYQNPSLTPAERARDLASRMTVREKVGQLNQRLESRQLKVELTEKALDTVIDRGFDPNFGARPLRRYLQAHVETLIARKVIAADTAPGSVLTVDADDRGELVISDQ